MELKNGLSQRLTVADAIYYLSISLYFIVLNLSYTMFSYMINSQIIYYVRILATALILFKIFILDRIPIPKLIIILLGLVLVVYSYHVARTLDILELYVLMVGAHNVDLKKVVSLYLIINFVSLIVGIIAVRRNVIIDLTYTRDGVMRHSLGKVYPTLLASNLFYMTGSLVYLLKDAKLKWVKIVEVILILIFSYFSYSFTKTRTDFICSLLLVLLVYLNPTIRILSSKITKIILTVAPLLIFILSLYVMVNYSSSSLFWNQINKFSNERLYFSNFAYNNFPPNLLGQYIEQNGNGGLNNLVLIGQKYFYIDSSFIRVLLMNGMIIFTLFYIVIQRFTIISLKHNNYTILILLLITLVEGFFSSSFLIIAFNPLLLLLFNTESKRNVINQVFEVEELEG